MTQQQQEQNKGNWNMANPWPSWRAHLLFWPIAAGGMVLDLWTKKAIFDRLGPADSVQIIPGFLQLLTVTNKGAAWGLAHGHLAVLVAVSVVALVVILGLFLQGGNKPALTTVVLGLFAGGVLGNLWDRLFNNGEVRDFIDVYIGTRHWPTFNVADTLLCVAVGLLLIATLATERHGQTRDRPQR